MNKQEAIDTIKILKVLVEIAKTSIIKNTFVSAFLEKSIKDETVIQSVEPSKSLALPKIPVIFDVPVFTELCPFPV